METGTFEVAGQQRMTSVQYIFFLVYLPHLERKFHGTGILNVLFTSVAPAPNGEPMLNKQIKSNVGNQRATWTWKLLAYLQSQGTVAP